MSKITKIYLNNNMEVNLKTIINFIKNKTIRLETQ